MIKVTCLIVLQVLFSGGRILNMCGSALVFGSIIWVSTPDYLGASNLDELCPKCGDHFNQAVKQVAEFTIGLFFSGLFTLQLLPILITITPSLVRVSIFILCHPALKTQECNQYI